MREPLYKRRGRLRPSKQLEYIDKARAIIDAGADVVSLGSIHHATMLLQSYSAHR
jgi:hypothetical protein